MTVQLATIWRQAIELNRRLLLDVPRAHSATTFLRELLSVYHSRVVVRKKSTSRVYGTDGKHIREFELGPQKADFEERPLHLLMIDQPVYPMRWRPHYRLLENAWDRWVKLDPIKVVVMATITDASAPHLIHLMPAPEWTRIQFKYDENLDGRVWVDGELDKDIIWECDPWTREKLRQRLNDLGSAKFARAFQQVPPGK